MSENITKPHPSDRRTRHIFSSGVAITVTDSTGTVHRLPLAIAEARALRAILAGALADSESAVGAFTSSCGRYTEKAAAVCVVRAARDVLRFLERRPVRGTRAITNFRIARGAVEGDVETHGEVEDERHRARMGQAEDELGLGSLLKAAKCHEPADGKPWHMLRHTFASNFVMAGGSLFTLQQLLGHSTPMMTQRYAHLAPQYLAAEIARMSFAAPLAAEVHDLEEHRRLRATAP